ncbi:MAG: hypothetical protein ACM34K_12900, partial [Bacillota bacterium]
MTNNIRFLFVLLLLELTLSRLLQAQQVFTIDLKDRKSDLFKVTLLPEKLSKENDIYQFASTAPGTYQQMDIGRFVKTFAAYDQEGKELKSERISINQWKLIEPEKIKKIFYTVEDTWDTPVDSNQIYPMGGSTPRTGARTPCRGTRRPPSLPGGYLHERTRRKGVGEPGPH